MNQTNSIRIIHERCIQCRLCAIECPAKTASTDLIRADQNSPLCERCFHCYAICPQHAIQVEGSEEEVIPAGHHVTQDDLLMLLKKRRSIRKYKKTPVPNDNLKLLTESTKYSPTGGNFQDLSITIINNLDTREELEQAVISYYDKIVRLLRNPVIRLLMRFSGDPKVKETARDKEFFSRIRRIYNDMKAGEKNIFWDAPVVMLFHTSRLLPTALEDCILAASNVVMTAMSLKMGSCFVSLSQQAITADRKIKRMIGIPPADQVHAVLVLGFPATRYRRVPPRKEKNIRFR
jgi:nitroreductase/Pyruvate/2-oxoacid:ferredoxin oxidoreductase delta subunit